MNRRKSLIFGIVVAMIAGTAVLLAAVPQRLGPAGVKASPIEGNARWQIYLPDSILGFASTNQEVDATTMTMLPADTSIAQKIYTRPGHIPFAASVVLMGTDRTSIHKAEYCLQGQGLHLDTITQETIRMSEPQPYELPIVKILATYNASVEGKTVTKKCVYMYWYVTDGVLSNDRSGAERMWSMTRQLALTGILQRWAYVRFYGFCDPGQENLMADEIKQAIIEGVPQFQLTPRPANMAETQH